MRIESPRPLSDVALRIEQLSGHVVSYEDAPFRYPGDVHRNPTGQLVPRGGLIEIRYRSGAVRQALDDALAQHELAGLPGWFEIEDDADASHVVPTGYRTSAAGTHPWQALMRTPVSLTLPAPSGLDVVSRITDALAAAREVTVSIGSVPVNLLAQYVGVERRWSGQAGALLLQLFSDIGRLLSWQLLHDPGTGVFVLNIHPLTGAAGGVSGGGRTDG
jgi:hypothetical protein